MNFLCGGRLGDLIHCLYVMYATYKVTGHPNNLYITNDTRYGGDKFVAGIEKTYEELKHLISLQKYIDKFEIYRNEIIQINLNSFRKSKKIGSADWTRMLSGIFKVPLYFEPWITLDESYYDPKYKDMVIIHRTMVVYHTGSAHVRYTHDFSLMLHNILRRNSGQCYFLSTDDNIYNAFNDTFGKYHQVPKITANTIDEILTIINSCKFFIGNQTSPSAFCVALHHPMLVEAVCIDNIYHFDEQYPRFYRYSENSVCIKNLDREIFL